MTDEEFLLSTSQIKRNRYLMSRKIFGKITDISSGEPVEGVRIRAFDSDINADDRMGEAFTKADGSYEINYSDLGGWKDVSNYSTIQTAVVNNELFLLARANAGMHTYRLVKESWYYFWSRVQSNSPEWSDAKGWDDVSNYSTIQTAVVNNELFLLARANAGMHTYRLVKSGSDYSWSRVQSNSPEWSDAKGWDDVSNYSTIQTAVVNNELFLLARANAGMHTYRLVKSGSDYSWSRVQSNSPEWSDAKGWDDVSNYSTIQTAVVNNELFLLARANAGMHTYRLVKSGSDYSWSRVQSNSPEWSDAKGWDDVSNYSTIQTAVVNNELFLLARANAGMHTYRLVKSGSDYSWSRVQSNSPEWSDAKGWDDVSNYSTIQTAVVNNELFLLARANAGMHTYRLVKSGSDYSWSRVQSNSPEWSDAKGWDDVSNYSTIQTAVVNNELFLLARANAGMHTYRLVKSGSDYKWQFVESNSPAWSDGNAHPWDKKIPGSDSWRPDIYIKVAADTGHGWTVVYNSAVADGIKHDWKMRKDLEINTDVVLPQPGACTIQGNVLWQDNSEPIENATIQVWDKDLGIWPDEHDFMTSGRTDADGKFYLTYPAKNWDDKEDRSRFPDIHVIVKATGANTARLDFPDHDLKYPLKLGILLTRKPEPEETEEPERNKRRGRYRITYY